MKTDFHIHSFISTDSRLKHELIIEKAIERAYSKIAFTDHYEPKYPNWSFEKKYSLDSYYKTYLDLKERYKDKIDILFGIEIGEYQEFTSKVDDFLVNYKFDIRIGSIHYLPPEIDIATPMGRLLSTKQIEQYYKINLKLVENCNINVLGHLGVFHRYDMHNIDCAKPILKDIFQVMIEREIALEINFSGLRKPSNALVPTIPVIEQYASEGGKLLSFGSDSHVLNAFDDKYDQMLEQIKRIGIDYRIITCQ